MLIICHIDWREVGVAFELQCLRNCTLSSFRIERKLKICDTSTENAELEMQKGYTCLLCGNCMRVNMCDAHGLQGVSKNGPFS